MGPVFRQWQGDGPNDYMRGNHSNVIPVMHDAHQPPIDCDWVEGSVCVVRRECVEDVGPLDPWLFFYWEEADFCRRARHRGWRVVIVPGCVCRHFAGGSTVTERNRSPVAGLMDRNYYLYKLCDPAAGFIRNLWRTLHLFAANQKHWLIDHFRPRAAWSHVRTFVSVLFELPGAWSKWRRDRTGGRPPKFTAEIAALVNR
jgi:GT2 family glycosyltransferase